MNKECVSKYVLMGIEAYVCAVYIFMYAYDYITCNVTKTAYVTYIIAVTIITTPHHDNLYKLLSLLV